MGSGEWMSLRRVFEEIPDPRGPRGLRFTLPDLLTTAASAVLSGADTYLAIAEGAKRHALGLADKGVAPASKDTFGRILSAVDADALDQYLGSWSSRLAGRADAVAVDGKEIRGARRHGERVHLLSATTHGAKGVVIGQVAVGEKTNEIPMVPVLLDQVGDIKDLVITLDALHCQRATQDPVKVGLLGG